MSEDPFDWKPEAKKPVAKKDLIKLDKKPLKAAGCGPVLLVVGLIFLSFVVCGFVPAFLGGIVFDNIWFIPGDASKFDPVARFPDIQDFAGADYHLHRITARFVRSDGTLDIFAPYSPSVEYRFHKEVQNQSDLPLGAGGTTSSRQFQEVEVEISYPSSGIQFIPDGMDKDIYDPRSSQPSEAVPPPECPFADLWQVAIERREAPASAVAIIEYEADGYNFRIQDTSISLDFNLDCTLKEE